MDQTRLREKHFESNRASGIKMGRAGFRFLVDVEDDMRWLEVKR
jgi:hypothetical protein